MGEILSADWSVGARREWRASFFDKAGAAIDWPTFAHLAWQHKLRPMAVSALQEAGWPRVPQIVREGLEATVRDCTLKTLRQLQVQAMIADAARSAELRVVTLKGPALSARLFGNPLIRESFDLDLFVAPDDTSRLKGLLETAGFEPRTARPRITVRQSAILARYANQEEFVHPGTGVIVDVHHSLCGNPWPAAAGFENLWRGRQSIRVGRTELSIPGDADLVQYLVCHAATHGWQRWKWVGDLVALYRSLGPDALTEHRDAARRDGWHDLFDSALLITAAITGGRIPAGMSDCAVRNKTAVRMADRSLRLSTQPKSPEYCQRYRYMFRMWVLRLQLGRRPRYIAHEIAAMMHRPDDWYELRLPDALIPAYYILRPVLFVGRRLRCLLATDGGSEPGHT